MYKNWITDTNYQRPENSFLFTQIFERHHKMMVAIKRNGPTVSTCKIQSEIYKLNKRKETTLHCSFQTFQISTEVYQCILSLYQCILSLYQCILSLYQCIHSLYQCVLSLYQCILSLYQCILSLYQCILSLYLGTYCQMYEPSQSVLCIPN